VRTTHWPVIGHTAEAILAGQSRGVTVIVSQRCSGSGSGRRCCLPTACSSWPCHPLSLSLPQPPPWQQTIRSTLHVHASDGVDAADCLRSEPSGFRVARAGRCRRLTCAPLPHRARRLAARPMAGRRDGLLAGHMVHAGTMSQCLTLRAWRRGQAAAYPGCTSVLGTSNGVYPRICDLWHGLNCLVARRVSPADAA